MEDTAINLRARVFYCNPENCGQLRWKVADNPVSRCSLHL